jgi:hypothetical protein
VLATISARQRKVRVIGGDRLHAADVHQAMFDMVQATDTAAAH